MISDFYLIEPKRNDRTVGGFMHAIWLIRSRERALLIYKQPGCNVEGTLMIFSSEDAASALLSDLNNVERDGDLYVSKNTIEGCREVIAQVDEVVITVSCTDDDYADITWLRNNVALAVSS
jgi:hypothetical protein